MTYEQQLETPEWHALTFLVKDRDGHKCMLCFSTETLQVHHKKYLPERLAWEYDLDYLITLCRECHERHHGLNGKGPIDRGIPHESSFYDDKWSEIRRSFDSLSELNRQILRKEIEKNG